MFDDIGVGITFILNNYDEVKEKIRTLQESLHLLSKAKIGDSFGEANTSLSSMMGKLDNMNEAIKSMTRNTTIFNRNVSGLEGIEITVKKAAKHTSTLSSNMKTALSNAKKFAFSLLTVRGVWFAIRKAMTTYLSQNEELQNKLNAVYYAVGSLFAPLLELMVNGLIQIIGYLNTVVKALGFAGINMSNYGKATSSAAKETAKLLSIDEINNLSQSSGSSTSVSDAIAAIENVKLNEKLLEFSANLGITLNDVFLDWSNITSEQLYKKINVGLGAIFGYVVGGLPGALVGIGIALAMDSIIFDNDGIISRKERLMETIVLGIAGALGGFMIGGGLGAIVGLTVGVLVGLTIASEDVVQADINEGNIQEALKKVVYHAASTMDAGEMEVKVNDIKLAETEDIMEMFRLLGGECSEEQAKGYYEGIQNGTISADEFFNAIKENISSANTQVGSEAGQALVEAEAEAIASDTESIPTAVESANNFQDTYDQLKEDASLSGAAMITAMTSGVVDNKGEILTAWSEIKTSILGYWQEMEVGIKDSCNNIISSIEGMLNNCIKGLNGLSSSINSLSYDQKSLMGITFTLADIPETSLPRLATGTNYVPNDMVAMIHQGEAVVPKEFNPSAFYGGNTAEELNLLAQINEQLVRLNAKDTDIKLDGESVAKKVNQRIEELSYRNGSKVFAVVR